MVRTREPCCWNKAPAASVFEPNRSLYDGHDGLVYQMSKH